MSEAADAPALPKWFWIVGAGLAVAVCALIALWYVRHPGRTPFADFTPGRGPLAESAATNGHVPSHPATVGADADEGEGPGEA